MYNHCHYLTVEWGDCDPAGIVFYPRFFAMFDAATAYLLESASGMCRAELIRHHDIIGWPMVDTRGIFHAPVSYDDKICIDGTVTRVGTSSFDIQHKLYCGNKLCVECTETRVWAAKGAAAEAEAMRPVPIPEELRANLISRERKSR